MLILKALSAGATAALVALMLYAGEPAKLWWWLLAIPFGLWICGPALAPYVLAKWLAKRHGVVATMTAFLLISSAWSALVYHDAFFMSESSTAALIMLFAPLYQWCALVATLVTFIVVTAWLERRRPG